MTDVKNLLVELFVEELPPKALKKLGEAFYGRLKAYETALQTLPDRAAVTDLLTRTVLEGRAENGGDMVDYVLSARDALSGQTVDSLLAGQVTWERAQ